MTLKKTSEGLSNNILQVCKLSGNDGRKSICGSLNFAESFVASLMT